MQNINNQSVIKAAAIGAGINAVIGIVGGLLNLLSLDFLTVLFGLVACCGWALVPIGTGALYGYFTPGKETLQQGALGGALSGVVAGLVYGVINSVVTAATLAWDSADIATALSGSAFSLIISCCGAFLVGGVLGAIGGAIWTAVQKDK